MKKLDCILLVDDNDADNYYHQMIIEEVGCAEAILALENAFDALDYIKSVDESVEQATPNIIFLDINMPGMNGWEFLDEYEKLSKEQKANVMVIMLSTSQNPDDKIKAKAKYGILEFVNKPLTEETLKKLIKKHFPDVLE
ncbi:response regulator receiver domain-containing protein [Roseivirga pacifica]|uniref:Response regulator receiver domain-containing protein n=1 Tax=Roseivirga pacifica TaxID=1267423 RepID=A0A1I0QQK4_9BACT|nr:response regulator [Roseivirga pacifica]RKQ42693.1 response regulator receiver domain-containing protein [Roseivirga pacifica]SEW29626.1 Response regulator receiver domain-containing protein [Roseivirga pacifica]